MGIYEREYYRDNPPPWYTFSEHRTTKALIAVNVAVYVVQLATSVRVEGMGEFTGQLMMNPAKVFHDGQVWRLLTAAFLHGGPFHLLFNMLALWFFAPDAEDLYGPKEFLAFYLVGGILGNLAWGLTAFLMVPDPRFLPFMNALGASGAVAAVLMLVTCHHPNRTVLVNFFIPMPLWAMTLLYVGLDAFYFMRGLDQRSPVTNVAVAAHLGGALWGGIYYYFQFRLLGWWKGWGNRRVRRPALKVYRPAPASADDEPFAPRVKVNSTEQQQLEARLDAVLAKLGREGKDQLTQEELAILQQASEIYRRKRT